MSGQNRRPNRSRKNTQVRPDPVTFWREDEVPAQTPSVTLPVDPTATIRSLGPPPLPDAERVSNEFLKTVLRASSLVGALARSVDLVEEDTTDEQRTAT